MIKALKTKVLLLGIIKLICYNIQYYCIIKAKQKEAKL